MKNELVGTLKTSWINVEHDLPQGDCVCMVSKEPWSAMWQATYDCKEKMFSLSNPGSLGFLPLDVTHYLVIPEQPWYE